MSKSKVEILILFLLSELCWCQSEPQAEIRGRIISDSTKVDNVLIFNANSKSGTVSDSEGYFTIHAKEKDTLVFSSLLFRSKRIVVSKASFRDFPLKVKLETYTNALKEVVVTKKLAPAIGSSRSIVDQKYFDDVKSSPKNRYLTTDGSIENGMDFVRMYKDVMKLLRKKNPNKTNFVDNIDFAEEVTQRIDYSFFSKTLQLKDDQLRLFLVFCENDPKSKTILKATQFELADFLVVKNIEFKKIISGEKK